MGKSNLITLPMAAVAAIAIALALAPGTALADEGIPMYRLYNPNSGEHFYTANENERDNTVAAGWEYEGVGWTAPESGEPVYRVYNPYAGEHHYTMKADERDGLITQGWADEGMGWFSDPNEGTPIYREYNPNMLSCNHNYTSDLSEHASLVSLGWADEGEAWYGIGAAEAPSTPDENPDEGSETDPVSSITLQANGTALSMTLADSQAASALVELLRDGPISVSLHSYGGFEKVGTLPQALPASDEQITTAPGDVMLYQGNQITIFYGSNTWAYTPLGYIEGATKESLLEAFGDEDVAVELSL